MLFDIIYIFLVVCYFNIFHVFILLNSCFRAILLSLSLNKTRKLQSPILQVPLPKSLHKYCQSVKTRNLPYNSFRFFNTQGWIKTEHCKDQSMAVPNLLAVFVLILLGPLPVNARLKEAIQAEVYVNEKHI